VTEWELIEAAKPILERLDVPTEIRASGAILIIEPKRGSIGAPFVKVVTDAELRAISWNLPYEVERVRSPNTIPFVICALDWTSVSAAGIELRVVE
jgi:hypothetical protein